MTFVDTGPSLARHVAKDQFHAEEARRHRISRAFTFDRHFETAGFTIWP